MAKATGHLVKSRLRRGGHGGRHEDNFIGET
jgi:hypothetical protein